MSKPNRVILVATVTAILAMVAAIVMHTRSQDHGAYQRAWLEALKDDQVHTLLLSTLDDGIDHNTEALMEAWKNEHDRDDMLSALGDIENERALVLLRLATISDEDDDCRMAAVEALGNSSAKGVLTLLRHALEDDNELVRIAAVRGLGKRGGKEVLLPLVDALDDREHLVRGNAVVVLGELKDTYALESLRQIADEDENLRVREVAKKSIEQILEAQEE